MQTSITTWLKKPAVVKQPSSVAPDASIPISHAVNTSNDSENAPQPAESRPKVSTPSRSPPSIAESRDQPTSTPETSTLETSTLETSSPEPLSNPTPTLKFGKLTRPLVTNISLIPCSKPYISSFQRLNTILLPIPYPQSFYKEILSDPVAQDLTILAIWHDTPPTVPTPTTTKNPFSILSTKSEEKQGRVIAGIRCRILPSPSATDDKLLYISTLGVLSPFRHYGIATHLLHAVVATAVTKYGVNAIGAHVWEASEDAREWYAKRGFRETRREEGYYRKLKPQGAWVLRREIGVRDLL